MQSSLLICTATLLHYSSCFCSCFIMTALCCHWLWFFACIVVVAFMSRSCILWLDAAYMFVAVPFCCCYAVTMLCLVSDLCCSFGLLVVSNLSCCLCIHSLVYLIIGLAVVVELYSCTLVAWTWFTSCLLPLYFVLLPLCLAFTFMLQLHSWWLFICILVSLVPSTAL